MTTPKTLAEVWAILPDFNGLYGVSSFGRVRRERSIRRYKAGRILKGSPDRKGYLRVSLGPTEDRRYIHQLVAELFLGPCPEGKEVDHKDGNRQNNCLDNLEYVTHAENQARSAAAGRMARGGRNGLAKLSEENILDILRRLADWEPQASIAERYGVRQATISKIRLGKRWKHLPIPERRKGHKSTLKEPQVILIVARLKAGEKSRTIAADYGVGYTAIDAIKSGRTWGHVPRS